MMQIVATKIVEPGSLLIQEPETSATKFVATVTAKPHGFPLEINGKLMSSLFYVSSFAPQQSIMHFPLQHTQFEGGKKKIGVMIFLFFYFFFYKCMTSIEPNEDVVLADIIWRGSGSLCIHMC